MDEILAEIDLVAAPAVGRQGRQGFLAGAAPGFRIDGGDGAAGARFDHPHGDVTNPDAPPAVLGIGLGTGHHQIRAKAPHRHRLRQPPVEIVEGRLGNQQQRKAVGKGGPLPGAGVAGIHLAFDVVREPHQTARNADGLAQPAVSRRAHRNRRHRVAPHLDPPARSPGIGGGHSEGAQFGMGQRQTAVAIDQAGSDARHLGMLALGEKPPRRVHHHPAPVEMETEVVQVPALQGDTTQGLDRIQMDFAQDRNAHGSMNPPRVRRRGSSIFASSSRDRPVISSATSITGRPSR